MEFIRSSVVSLKAHPELNEKWLQGRIVEDTTILGLGDLVVKDVERRQPRAGRLDLLLFDPETDTRYEIELQLGPTDESHIIRTIEYWDLEKRRYPQYEHVAVIVAEDITSRFLNVISLFNGFIPLIAIQLQALEVGGSLTLAATKVLDTSTLGNEDDDEGAQATDRAYWESRATKKTLATTDNLLELIHKATNDPTISLKYNKHYIGLARDGVADNFVTFRPRKDTTVTEFKIPRSDELTARLDETGLDVIAYQNRWGQYRVRLTEKDITKYEDVLIDLIRRARGLAEE